jgi:hypothetical protein
VTLEPAITMTVDEMLAEEGLTRLSTEEFTEQFRDLPPDGEGGDRGETEPRSERP